MHFPWWWRGTAIDRPPETRHALDGGGEPGRHRSIRLERNVLRQSASADREFVDHPMDEGRRIAGVWILEHHGKLFRSGRHVAPYQRRRHIAAISRVLARNRLIGFECRALDRDLLRCLGRGDSSEDRRAHKRYHPIPPSHIIPFDHHHASPTLTI